MRYHYQMGVLERSAKSKRRWGTFRRSLLAAAAVGGVVLIAAAMPNVAQLLKYFPGYKKGARFNYRTKSTLGRLVATGHLVFVEKNGKRYARLTEKGKRAFELETMRRPPIKKRWDRHWRVVIFDIPERRKSVRARLRRFMKEYGFVRLQDSVWIYPYDCEDLIALAKAHFHIGADVLYMIVERLERDNHLRQHFSLPAD